MHSTGWIRLRNRGALQRMAEQLALRLRGLQNNDALLTAVVDSLSEGVLAIGARRTVLQMNAAARGMLRVHEPIPFSVDSLPPHGQLRDAISEALSGRTAGPYNVELFGHTLTVTGRPLSGRDAVLIVSDLTNTRRLESMRRDFVANVSHELRTPLTVIGGFAETLMDSSIPEADREKFASRIVSNTRRMQRIVDELLDLSRIESGGWTPHPAEVDIAALASDTFSSCADAAVANDVTLEAHIAPDARRVHADPTALRQVLGNLVENAVRHTTHGSVIVFARRDVPGVVWIEVRDSGVGIAPAHLPRIFERFYRADSARARDSGGTGLGLAVVKHLVEAHGGEVRAESTVGRGTTISIALPQTARPDLDRV